MTELDQQQVQQVSGGEIDPVTLVDTASLADQQSLQEFLSRGRRDLQNIYGY
jgi:hypothetical protein